MHVLSVSFDSTLLESRELILRKLGFQVTSALGFSAAIRHCEKAHFDLFLLGHSIPTADKRALIETFQRNCPAPVVEMHLPNQLATGAAQYEFDSSRSPKELAELVRKIIGT
jgi:DNA-binding response OmpR family regulator